VTTLPSSLGAAFQQSFAGGPQRAVLATTTAMRSFEWLWA
jgi:hypothetical protein